MTPAAKPPAGRAGPLCPKGTFNGPAAEASPFGFAPCALELGHTGDCESSEALLADGGGTGTS
jgi:hypothetical protein